MFFRSLATALPPWLSGSSAPISHVPQGQATLTSWLSGQTSPISHLPSRSVPSYLWIDPLTSRINRPATRESPSTRPTSRSSGPINHSSGPTSQLSMWISRLTSRSVPLSARIRRGTQFDTSTAAPDLNRSASCPQLAAQTSFGPLRIGTIRAPVPVSNCALSRVTPPFFDRFHPGKPNQKQPQTQVKPTHYAQK
jgi:hypothetical protein